MYFGMRFGNFFGETEAAAIYANITADDPGGRTLSWTPTNASGAAYHVMFDQAQFARTSEVSLDGVPQDARDHIEVIETTDQNFDEIVTRFASSPSDRIKLSWDEVAGAERYEVYRKESGGEYGDPIAIVTAGRDNYEVIDGPHDDATYVYKLTAYDAAGNSVDSNEPQQAVSAAPDPPSGIAGSVANNTFTMTYTASGSADVHHYAIYRGDAGAAVELTGSVHDTDAASPWEDGVTGLTGRYEYLLRAVDADTNEEANLSQMIVIDLVNGVQVSRPNSPVIGGAEAIAGGEVRVHARYDREGETGVATSIRMYVNDGAGGAMDWGTSKGSATLPTGHDFFFVDMDSTGLIGAKTYLVGIRARTDAGVEDSNTETVSILTDATPPGAPTLTAEIV